MARPDNILVIRGGAIGDFILTLPVLTHLRREFPQARITILGYPHIARLALLGGLADEVRPIEAQALASFFVPNAALPEEWAEFFRQFTVILSYLYDPDQIFAENVRRVSFGMFIPGPHRPNEQTGRHAADCLLDPLRALGIEPEDAIPHLEIHQEESSGSLRPLDVPVFAVHPGSGSPRKNWPIDRWVELLRRLKDQIPHHLCLIGGEADLERIEALREVWPEERLQIVINRPLEEVALVLHGSFGFVGHDSGISHLAGAIGTRSVVLWGPTKEQVWRPPQSQVQIVRDPDGLDRLSVETVLRVIERWILGRGMNRLG